MLVFPDFVALYGKFSNKMNPVKVENISKALLPFIKEGVMVLPKNIQFDTLFPNKIKGTKFLQIQLADNRKINILNDSYQFGLTVNLLNTEKPICVVYNIFINPNSDWRALISGQIADIKRYGLLDESDLYIHVTNTTYIRAVLPFIRKTAGASAIISESFSNQFEYPGIKLLYDRARQHPHKTYMYFHTKGMSKNIKKRNRQERAIMAGTFENWRKNMDGFQDPAVNKVGLFPAIESPNWGGWIWFNYFMVRGTYLYYCDEPLITTDRYYYESWLGRNRGEITVNDGYATFTHKKESFSQQQTVDHLETYTDNYTKRRKMENLFYRLFLQLKSKRLQ